MSKAASRKVAVITGASSGIGKASAIALGRMGWRIIGVGRDPGRCVQAESDIRAALGEAAHIDFLRADFDSMAQVLRVASEIAALTNHVDVLVNNAGGVRNGAYRTVDGLEATFAANHLAAFLLTREMLPLIQPGGRIIAVSSSAHEYCAGMNWDDLQYEQGFSAGAAYCQAKLANLLFTRELARRCADQGIVAQAMHPGIIASNFYSHGDASMQAHLERDGGQPPEHAARTIAWMATSSECGEAAARYFHDCAEVAPAPQAQDDAAAARLWQASEAILAGLALNH